MSDDPIIPRSCPLCTAPVCGTCRCDQHYVGEAWVCHACYITAWPTNVHFVFHDGLPSWVRPTFLTTQWIDWLRHGFPNVYGVVQFFPRAVTEGLVWQAWFDARRANGRPTEPYSYRGWCKGWSGEIIILVDDTETTESLQWIVLHELGHMSVTNAKFVDRAMELENKNDSRTHYEWKDDAGHEADSEERLVNRVATAYMGGKEYARPWWRPRVQAKLAGLPPDQWPDNPTPHKPNA